MRWRLRWQWRRRRRKLPFWTTTAVTGLSWIDVWAGIFKANGQFSIAASASSKAAAGRAAMATATFYQRNGAYATYKGGYVLIKNNGILLLLPPPDLFDLHLSVLGVRVWEFAFFSFCFFSQPWFNVDTKFHCLLHMYDVSTMYIHCTKYIHM